MTYHLDTGYILNKHDIVSERLTPINSFKKLRYFELFIDANKVTL